MDNYIAKTFAGLEIVLSEELKTLGAKNIQILKRAVSFEADHPTLYRINMCVRTATRVLMPIEKGHVYNQDQLYRFVRTINWTRYFSEDKTMVVYANVANAPNFNNSAFVALKVKDAIVDQFREFKNKRPSIDKRNPNVQIHVHLMGKVCTVLLDTSGPALFKRGYRRGGHRAPLNEVLAAGLVLKSGWDFETPLLDPMCGSGTILTEAALYAKNIAPNVHRQDFSFMHWKDFRKKTFNEVWIDVRASERKFEGVLYGSDIDPYSIEEARQNVFNAKVDEDIRLSTKSFADRTTLKQPGTLIINPPYGERLQMEAIDQLYKDIGFQLKHKYEGSTAWLFTSNIKALRKIGLKPSEKQHLFNGALECQFVKYELYKGSKKTSQTK